MQFSMDIYTNQEYSYTQGNNVPGEAVVVQISVVCPLKVDSVVLVVGMAVDIGSATMQ